MNDLYELYSIFLKDWSNFFIHLDIPIEEKIQRMFELFFCAADENQQDNQLSKEEFTSQLGQVCRKLKI